MVQRFEYYQPTQVICGEGAAARAGSFARVFGSKVLIVSGEMSARRTGALIDVEASLSNANIPFERLEGIPTNPSAAVVDAGAALARSTSVDVIVAVGGGSVIDVAKAIAVAAPSGVPYRHYLSGIRREGLNVDTTIPLIAVPTLPGSGSETNGTSVIIDDISGRKLSSHSDLAAPRIALLDGAYAIQAPRRLLADGLADALCHAIEAALSIHASAASDGLALAAIGLLRDHAEAAVGGEDLDALTTCLWASNLAGQALALAGSTVTHPLAHPLSARSGAHHGAAVAALEPVVLMMLADRWGDHAVKLGRWFGSSARTAPAALKVVLDRLAAFNASIGVTDGVADLGLGFDLIDSFVSDALASGSRGLSNTLGPEFTREDLAAIYARALDCRPDEPLRIVKRAATAAR